jgi:hypothetical protein
MKSYRYQSEDEDSPGIKDTNKMFVQKEESIQESLKSSIKSEEKDVVVADMI